jgi:lipopolysaccharide transport system ATP-binding protein
MPNTVIRIENLSKRYLVGHRLQHTSGRPTLRDVIAREARNFVGKAVDVIRGHQIVHGDEVEEFWALKDVSFDVNKGEVIGIIGRNGAGKSTLLKILSRITDPTRGKILLKGRVGSLLEVGTGFHSELTGRENIFLNGAILGMTREEVRKKFDEIVAFAEVERFLDIPVKHYSSGMYVRLAFAVAAHLEPEILIIDEVLAVGDSEFQRRCLGKMAEVAHDGRTILFVSHNLAAVRALCSHGIVLQSGCASSKLDVQSALNQYSEGHQLTLSSSWARPEELVAPNVRFKSIDVRVEGVQPKLQLVCDVMIQSTPGARPVFIAVDISDFNSVPIMQAIPRHEPFINHSDDNSWISLRVDLPPLIPGVYHSNFWIGPHYSETFDHIRDAISFEIVESPSPERMLPHSSNHGHIVPVSRASVRNQPCSG